MTSAAEAPNFFKVFLPECSSERLHIPDAFVALTRFRERVPEEFILRNGRGRDFKVKTSSVGHRVFFENGWERFVGEHALQRGDFVVFQYDGSNLLKFKIYEGSSSCEKPELEKEEEEEEELEEKEGGNGVMEEDKDEGDDDDEDDDEKDYEEDDEGDDDDDDDEEHILTDHPRAGKASIIGKKGTTGSSGSKADNLDEYVTIAAKCFSHRDNPYFFAKQFKGRNNELPIPYNIIKDLSLSLPETITLRCQYVTVSSQEQTIREGRWPHTGKIHTWKDGRVCIKEWSPFCRKNKIEANDTCICEIVLGEDMKVEGLQVHVIRRQI